MTTLARRSATLADHYHLERVVGVGGMATVDPAAGRKPHEVALGVLKPERATVVGAEETGKRCRGAPVTGPLGRWLVESGIPNRLPADC